jgi:hypothetical protein
MIAASSEKLSKIITPSLGAAKQISTTMRITRPFYILSLSLPIDVIPILKTRGHHFCAKFSNCNRNDKKLDFPRCISVIDLLLFEFKYILYYSDDLCLGRDGNVPGALAS